MRRPETRFDSSAEAPALQLVLRLDDGSPWHLSVPPAMKRFIGHYPLVEGLRHDGPLLIYRRADAG